MTPKHIKFAIAREKEVQEGVKTRNFIKEYFAKSHAKSETIDLETLQLRFDTLATFLKTGVPLLVIDGFRPLIEGYSGKSLTSSTHMRQLIPTLLEQEIHTIKEEICKSFITVIFDGTTRVCEVFSIIFRYVTNDFDITESLVELGKYQHGFNHEELVSAVRVILTKYEVILGTAERGRIKSLGQVISFQRDRCVSSPSSSYSIYVL